MADLTASELTAKEFKVGLRFKRGDARVLEGWLGQFAGDPRHSGTVGLFTKAADSARKGEPLILVCTCMEEAQAMAHGFTAFGITAPQIESLSGLLL